MTSTSTCQVLFDIEESKKKLKMDILSELEKSGFSVKKKELEHKTSKDDIRKLHRAAVENVRKKYKSSLVKNETQLIKFIANGTDIVPEDIKPKLIYVDANSEHWPLFNYIKIHWSVPISIGYGKRLCYIVFDDNTEKVIGIFGLQDPVFSIPQRDNYIGWSKEQKEKNMNMAMDGYVIGSVPPYNMILGGKLIASLLFSDKVRQDFKRKYKGTKSFILKREHPGDLVLITTLSALGKSTMYDRIRLPNEQRYISVGYSVGYGDFHFNGIIYKRMKELVKLQRPPSEKNADWGTGYRNRREVVHKALRLLNLDRNYIRHGVQRELFLIPLARNYKQVLINNSKPDYYNTSVQEITDFIKERWIIPRSKKNQDYKKWYNNEYLLWQ